MAWIVVVVAGLFEVAMALSLKESHGFSRPLPSILFAVFAIISFGLLSVALRTLPVGTGYAVWTGIGAVGTAIVGIAFLGEPRDAMRLVSIALIVAGVAGLRLASGSH
ncbi:MAG: quaternary ammonium compound efflux SMR transporter SugE [Thermomicrobiales bacterium]